MVPKRSRSFTLKDDPPQLCAVSSHSTTSRTDSSSSSSSALESQRKLPLPAFCGPVSGKKKVRFDTDDDGNELCTVFQVQSYREYAHLWWSGEQLTNIKSGCSDIASMYAKNKQFCAAIVNLMMNALQCEETEEDLDMFMKAMNDHGAARGLEPHIVAPCKKLEKIHYDAVLDVQQEAYDNGFYGSDKANADISQASIQTSRPFVFLALRQAQFDAREAVRAAFTRWSSDKDNTVKSKNGPSRRSSMSRIQSCRSMSSTTFYSSSCLVSGDLSQSDHIPKRKAPSRSKSTSSAHPLRRTSLSGGLSQSEHQTKRKTPSRSKSTSSAHPLRRSSIF